MNDRADALTEHGRFSEEPSQWPGPRKLDQLCLKVRARLRKIIGCLQDDNVPDKLLIQRAVEGIELIAARMKATVYSRLMLRDRKNCETILVAMASMPDSTARLWVQTVSGQYPTRARLHKMFPQEFS